VPDGGGIVHARLRDRIERWGRQRPLRQDLRSTVIFWGEDWHSRSQGRTGGSSNHSGWRIYRAPRI